MKISLLSRLLDLISPRTCDVCGGRLNATEHTICAPCDLHLPRTGFHLHPDDNPVARLFWGQLKVCRAASLFYFHPHSETARIIYGIKYAGRTHTAHHLGYAMAREMADGGFFNGIDLIVPIPLARSRRRQRGYNQSELIAQGVSEATGIALETRAVERRRFDGSQTSLSRWQRQDNVAGMFRLRDGRRISGRHVLLIDDVVTSGATIIACAKEMMQAGDVTVSVLTLAFTRG